MNDLKPCILRRGAIVELSDGDARRAMGFKYVVTGEWTFRCSNYMPSGPSSVRIMRNRYDLPEQEAPLATIHDGMTGKPGKSVVYPGFLFDGPSGPTVDTDNAMAGALLHDALYLAMRLGLVRQKFRRRADRDFRKILKDEGMSWLRRWLWFRAVRRFAAGSAKLRPGFLERRFLYKPQDGEGGGGARVEGVAKVAVEGAAETRR